MTLNLVRSIALALPEVEERPHFDYGSFRVRGKIFVTIPPDRQHIHVFAAEADRERALALYPEWAEKLLWGKKVVGVRVLLKKAPRPEVKLLLQSAWRHKAPNSLKDRPPRG